MRWALVAALALWASLGSAQSQPEWELYLHIMLPGQEPAVVFYGLMVSDTACSLAGQGMAGVLMATNPDILIGVSCVKRVEA